MDRLTREKRPRIRAWSASLRRPRMFASVAEYAMSMEMAWP